MSLHCKWVCTANEIPLHCSCNPLHGPMDPEHTTVDRDWGWDSLSSDSDRSIAIRDRLFPKKLHHGKADFVLMIWYNSNNRPIECSYILRYQYYFISDCIFHFELDRQSSPPGSSHKMRSSTKKSHENLPCGSKWLIGNPIGWLDEDGKIASNLSSIGLSNLWQIQLTNQKFNSKRF
jgi:hypothetical protein